MTGTPNPACPLCGLRFGSRPHLDLHIREDHRQRGHRNPGDTQMPLPPAGSASHRHNLASTPPRTMKEVTAMTATHRPRPGRRANARFRSHHPLGPGAAAPPPGASDRSRGPGYRRTT